MIDGKVQPIQRVVEAEDEDPNKTCVVTDSGKADDAAISKVDTLVGTSDNNDVVQDCEEIIGPSDIIKVEEEPNSTNVVTDSGQPDDAVVVSTSVESEAEEENPKLIRHPSL